METEVYFSFLWTMRSLWKPYALLLAFSKQVQSPVQGFESEGKCLVLNGFTPSSLLSSPPVDKSRWYASMSSLELIHVLAYGRTKLP